MCKLSICVLVTWYMLICRMDLVTGGGFGYTHISQLKKDYRFMVRLPEPYLWCMIVYYESYYTHTHTLLNNLKLTKKTSLSSINNYSYVRKQKSQQYASRPNPLSNKRVFICAWKGIPHALYHPPLPQGCR